MATADSEKSAAEETNTTVLDGSTYEILRNRMGTQGDVLRQRLQQLNESRKDVFGSIETRLDHTERITTEHNCVPRDIVAVGDLLLFGYNIQFGLRAETHREDVFAVYTFKEGLFHSESLDLIGNQAFNKDFDDVYRYYRNATFAKFFVNGVHLYMVFRVGKGAGDIKAFKWQIQSNSLTYLDNRSDHEVRFPPQHEFSWIRTHRDLHRDGVHPHISIDDRVFVETVGGDLTIKVENNTASGEGIFAEPVDDVDQTLDDAEIFYALIGNIILLKIRPYQEPKFRYIVYNEKRREARRLDAIEHACVLLPDDHGVIFSNGYYLQDGQCKLFENDLSNMLFEKRIPSPNGEDYLYVFYNRDSGTYILLQYNLIERKVAVPIICHGFTLLNDGSLLCFKHHQNPQKHHPVQIWHTPYVGEAFIPETHTDSYLYKIGNRDIVRGMAECNEILSLIEKEDNYTNLYVDLAKKTNDILDSWFWINNEQAFSLDEPLIQIHKTATAAVDEFEKVVRVRNSTRSQMKAVEQETREIVSAIGRKRFDNISEFVESLSRLRSIRGEIISLNDLRYVDESLVREMESQVVEETEKLAKRCVSFLLRKEALQPYVARVDDQFTAIDTISKVAEAKKLEADIDAGARELELLIEIVSNLKIDDATQRTTIIDRISTIFSKINQTRAGLKNRSQSLFSAEGIAEFNSQIKLLNQGVANYLDVCETPQQCEEYLTRVMVQLEELEGRFAEFDEFVVQLVEKRDEVYNIFETRRLQLVESRNKRCQSLADAADRILSGISSRVGRLDTVDEIHGYFASDLMIDKVRNIVDQLAGLEDTVRVDDIQTRLKTIQEETIRQLKDRQDLYSDGGQIIQLGTHRFSVTSQPLDLTTVFRDDQFYLHLTGTRFFEKLEHPDLLAARPVWNQEVISENDKVYRSEYLAFLIFRASLQSGENNDTLPWPELASLADDELGQYVAQFAGPRYNESYAKGVHDHDAALILRELLNLHAQIGLLQFSAVARTLGRYFWLQHTSTKIRNIIGVRVAGAAQIEQTFVQADIRQHYVDELAKVLTQLCSEYPLFDEALIPEAARYLYTELADDVGFHVSRQAIRVTDAFRQHLESTQKQDIWLPALKSLSKTPEAAFILARDWIRSFVHSTVNNSDSDLSDSSLDYVDEAALLLIHPAESDTNIIDAETAASATGLIGNHLLLKDGSYQLNYNHFWQKLTRFEKEVVPLYRRFVSVKKEAVEQGREEMRLDEFRPRVLTSFVRNQLLDKVYLPLIGDNLAKQIGAAGDQKRTDRMGLLLLVSPPGYGKTTLMEYIANRLGIVFMKINGPAIGHQVTSLDPAEAVNAAAREEIEKLNLALEMGDNVMIYLDDIQHCNAELLQKFISLCDAQRRIEGVYKGKTRTYDLRGRKVAVVMAGNPYTESGERFQIPDMLSNRADIYNLGDIIGDNAHVFEMSYLENCMTSNPTLSKVAQRNPQDVHALIKLAENPSAENVNLQGKYSGEEVEELVSTMKKLLHVRDVVLAVNREYIHSAAQSADYRTEPPFKLQGSYRNMNRMAEKVMPIMNDEELETLISSSYENDAQTLTSDAEANLLKFKELTNGLNAEDQQRWNEIKKAFQRNVKLRGVREDDQAGMLVAQISTIGEELEGIQKAMAAGMAGLSADRSAHVKEAIEQSEQTSKQIEQICTGLTGIEQAVSKQLDTLSAGKDSTQASNMQDVLKSLVQELRGTARGAAPAESLPAAERITVVNKIPSTLFNVLRSQFELMETWLQPLFSASQKQTSDLAGLQKQLQACLDNYSSLLKRMDSRHESDESE